MRAWTPKGIAIYLLKVDIPNCWWDSVLEMALKVTGQWSD
jgi:hypothetical protein